MIDGWEGKIVLIVKWLVSRLDFETIVFCYFLSQLVVMYLHIFGKTFLFLKIFCNISSILQVVFIEIEGK